VFCLAASADEIHRRVLADGERRDRPLLQVEDPRRRIGELLAERSPQYERFTQVPTVGLTPDEVAARLVELWGAGGGS
jgi:shikimate kinase